MYLFQMSDGMISDIKHEIIIVEKVRVITQKHWRKTRTLLFWQEPIIFLGKNINV